MVNKGKVDTNLGQGWSVGTVGRNGTIRNIVGLGKESKGADNITLRR